MNIRTVLNIYICIQTGRIIFQNFLFSLSAFAALSKFTIFFFLLLTVWSCSWHFCGDFLATCSMDNTSKIWDLNRLRTYMCLQWKQTIINTFLCSSFIRLVHWSSQHCYKLQTLLFTSRCEQFWTGLQAKGGNFVLLAQNMYFTDMFSCYFQRFWFFFSFIWDFLLGYCKASKSFVLHFNQQHKLIILVHIV